MATVAKKKTVAKKATVKKTTPLKKTTSKETAERDFVPGEKVYLVGKKTKYESEDWAKRDGLVLGKRYTIQTSARTNYSNVGGDPKGAEQVIPTVRIEEGFMNYGIPAERFSRTKPAAKVTAKAKAKAKTKK